MPPWGSRANESFTHRKVGSKWEFFKNNGSQNAERKYLQWTCTILKAFWDPFILATIMPQQSKSACNFHFYVLKTKIRLTNQQTYKHQEIAEIDKWLNSAQAHSNLRANHRNTGADIHVEWARSFPLPRGQTACPQAPPWGPTAGNKLCEKGPP